MNCAALISPENVAHQPDRIERDFVAFHLANPQVYEALRELALRLKRQGRKHYGMKALYEVVRFERAVGTDTRSTADWQLNNNFSALYARLLMNTEPELRNFFRTRQRRAPGAPRRDHLTLLPESA